MLCYFKLLCRLALSGSIEAKCTAKKTAQLSTGGGKSHVEYL